MRQLLLFICFPMIIASYIAMAALSLSAMSPQDGHTVASPGDINTIHFHLDESGVPFYSVQRKGATVLEDSRLGFELKGARDLRDGFIISSVETAEYDETWEQVWGEKQFIRNHYKEMKVHLSEEHDESWRMTLVFRAYDDGIGFRYEIPGQAHVDTLVIMDELTGFALTGDLITSYLILNLNEPNKLEDTSRIRPGKYVGIWWEMHLDKSTWGRGPRLGATTENAKHYIDFAAEHGFDHVLVEGWNPGWDENWYESGVVFDFTKSIPEFDLEGVAQYALDNGTRLMGHHENSATVLHYESQMEEGFALYEDLGVRAVKTGYVGHGQEIMRYDDDGNEQYEWHHGQFMVDHHQRVVELAASHNISLNVHEGVKDTGLRRTWPNLMTREVAVGQEYNAWGEWGGNPPDYVVILPFTRMLSGPFDYTPGVFDLHFDEYRPDNRIKHTLAKELALYVTIYSPLQMAADLPRNYEANPEPFQFILDVPADWYDTKVLHADIGNYVTIVRKDRNSDEWFLGSITDEQGRTLDAELSFLDAGRKYVAEIYRDGEEADWEDSPYDIVNEEVLVDSETVMPLVLAPGGGQAVRYRPADASEINRLPEF